MSKKFILILLDGLGDRSYQRLGNMTPLQAAHTPFMDRFARMGINGLFHASLQGQALPSENAHFAIFGYDQKDFPGRGALEALGSGIELNSSDVAVLAHFVNVREEEGCLRLMHDKVKAQPPGAKAAFKEVDRFESGNVCIELIPTKGLFGIVLLKGGVSPYITDSNPILDGRLLMKIKPWADFCDHRPSIDAARALNEYLSWAHIKLDSAEFNKIQSAKGYPTLNGLVTQRAGRLKNIVPFSQKFGLRGASVSAGAVYSGLCKYLGLDVISAPELDDPGDEIIWRIEAAENLLDKYNFLHIHSKVPDEAGHKKDPFLKKKVIERLDQGLEKSLAGLLKKQDLIVALTSDHSTPCKGDMVHCGEPVPLAILGNGVRIDQVTRFDEISASQGALGFVRGCEFMPMVLNYLDMGKLTGLMDTPYDQPYWPGNTEPFRLF